MNFPQQRELAFVEHLRGRRRSQYATLQTPGMKEYCIKQRGEPICFLRSVCRSELEDLVVGTDLTVA